MIMPHDPALTRILRAARAGRPLVRLTLSPRWCRVLIAAGARPAGADDSMTVSLPRGHPRRPPERERTADASPGHRGLALAARPPDTITEVCVHAVRDAPAVGKLVRDGSAVRMDLSELSLCDATRLVDFAAGLTFGLHGSIERTQRRVFLLSPTPDPSRHPPGQAVSVPGPGSLPD